MKHLLYLSALLIVSNSALAQDVVVPAPLHFHPAHELIIGHGFLPASQRYTNDYHRYDYDKKHGTGAIFATYRFHFSNLLSLGITGSYERQNGYWNPPMICHDYDPNTFLPVDPIYLFPAGKIQRSRYTIASEITFNYVTLGDGIVRFYSVVGLGYTYNHQILTDPGTGIRYYNPDGNPMVFNGYISPFGIRFGKALGGFVEFGTGYKGVFNYGMSYKF